MPLVKQTGIVVGARRNSNILCDVFLLSTLFMGILLTAPGCCAKIETQIKLLSDDYTVPTRTENDEVSSLSSSSDNQQPTVPQYNLYKNDLKRISYETIHRILRDENEPMIYRTNDLRYFQKRSSTTEEHEISKRSVDRPPPGISLNLTSSNLRIFSREAINFTHSLEDITSIILRNNSLREFPLDEVVNLTILDLSDNNFSHFEVPSENSQLRVLNLNRNLIGNFTTPTKLYNNSHSSNNLRELHLKDNSMRWLSQLNLSLLNELEILDLSCNQLENLETAFFPTRMKNLKYLNLARNRLQCIYRETFYNLLSMNTLVLSYNEIAEIDYETFLALPNLQYLDLSHNQLRGDSIRALQGIPDLVGLSIAYNLQLGDSMQEFVASWSLKELDASGTGLCKIPAALAQSVRTLKLAENWLTTINCGDLDSYPLLQYLDISHSHIDEIEEDALGRLEILETLFLDHNNLKRIPISLPTSLEHLFLHDNQIMDIQPQSFQGLNNLKTLDLSANKLLYLPDLPLPKLLTLNLQSSGINGLHQAIVKTSPHLRDLYLEDNPIKCADLLGIAEWASPCRNDRRIAERINIKSHYVRVHNYFERFQCGGNADKCARCIGDVKQSGGVPKGNTNRPNCVEVNAIGRPTITKTTTEMLIQERKNNEKPKDLTMTTAAAPTTKIPLTRETSTKESTKTAESTTDANQFEPSNDCRSSPTTPAEQPEVSTPKTTTTGSRIQTNSTDKILPSPQQKQLAAENPTATPNSVASIRRPSEIKSDNNYVETSAGSSAAPPGSLLSQENTGKSQKGLKAQSDNATKIGHSINGEISVAATATKSNLPTTALKQQQQLQIAHSEVEATTITMTMAIGQIPREKGSNEVSKEYQQQQKPRNHHHHQQQQQQQHNKIQEILHTKDRHLIGTPLLMHKGHVVLIPPMFRPPTAASVQTTATTTTNSKENLLLLAPRQNGRGSHGSSTTITTSKVHKLEMVVDTYPQQHHYQNHYQQQQQQQQQQSGSNENAIIKGAKKKTSTNGPLGQENHYQNIQQTQQQHKVHSLPTKRILQQQKQQNDQNGVVADNKEITTQQKFKETTTTITTTTPAMRNDKNQRHNNKEKHADVNGPTAEQHKQFTSNSEVTAKSGSAQQNHSSHSLNTPLDGEISPSVMVKDEAFKEINGSTAESNAIGGNSSTLVHHSRVNTALLKNDDDLQNLHTNTAPSNFLDFTMQPAMEGQKISGASTTAALIKLETGPRTEAVSPQQSIEQQHTVKSERWLDIRKATRHPGLVVVIGVTFAMVFILGLVQVYRYRQKPLNYIGHQHYSFQHEHHQHQYQQQDQDQDFQDRQHHHHHHHHQQKHHLHHPHHLNHESQPNNSHCGDGNNHNQCSNYGCNDDRMQPTSSSSSSYSSPHHLLRIHEKPPPPPPIPSGPSPTISNYEIQRQQFSSGYAMNTSSGTTSNYRLFQLNGKRIKHNQQQQHSSLSPDDENDFYTEMNHGPQSVLASDFFPMELLSAPSRMQSSPSMIVPLPPTDTAPHTHPPTAVSLVGHHHAKQQQQQRRTIDDEFQDIAAREKSKFEIW